MSSNITISSFAQSTNLLIRPSPASSVHRNHYWVICPKCKMTIPFFTLFISSDCPQINIKCPCTDKIQIIPLKEYIDFLITKPIGISSQVCGRHSDREAPFYCFICQEYLCKLCSSFHKEKYNTHFVSSKPIAPQNRCNKHPDKFQSIFCETCSIVICESCQSNSNSNSDSAQGDSINHHNHQTKQLSHIWTEINVKNIQDKYNEQKNNSYLYNHFKNRLIDQLTQLIEKYTKLKVDIQNAYQRYNDSNIILNHFIEIVLWHFNDIQLLPNANLMNALNKSLIINEAKLELSNMEINANYSNNNNDEDNKTIEDNAIKMRNYFNNNHILVNSIKCLNTFAFHSMGVNRLIELRDGKMVSSSYETIIWDRSKSNNNSIKNTENKTNQHQSIIKQIENIYINIESLIQLENGRIAIGASDKLIKVYDQYNGLYIGMFQGHETWINVLYQLKDGRLASGSYQAIKIWDTASYKCIGSLEENIGGSVISLCQLASNDTLLSGSEDGFIRQWDINEYKLIKVVNGHDGWINCIIQLQNDMLATGGNDNAINIWNNPSMKYIISLSDKDSQHSILCLCQLTDKRLLSGSFKVIKIWNVVTYQCITTISAHEDYITSIISLQDRSVASSSKDKLIKIWSI